MSRPQTRRWSDERRHVEPTHESNTHLLLPIAILLIVIWALWASDGTLWLGLGVLL